MIKNSPRRKLYATAFTIAAIAISFIVGTLLVYADWASPTSPPPFGNVAAPLHTGQNQTKAGGLLLNRAGTSETGLIVNCAPNRTIGCAGIGKIPGLIPSASILDPSAVLDVNGNIVVEAGILKPKGNEGVGGEVLKWAAAGTDWGKRKSWLTLPGTPSILDCSIRIGPDSSCEPLGYKKYGDYCLTDAVKGYSLTFRVCYADF